VISGSFADLPAAVFDLIEPHDTFVRLVAAMFS
jgi:hypothetical protein